VVISLTRFRAHGDFLSIVGLFPRADTTGAFDPKSRTLTGAVPSHHAARDVGPEEATVKPEWERSTRICPSIEFEPALLQALRDYVELHELGPVEAQALVSYETVSRRLKKPGLTMRLAGAGHMEMTQAVIVTPTRLVWAQRAGKDESFARSQLLMRLELSDYEKSPAAQLIPDHGLEVHGIEAQGSIGSVMFMMGEGPDADRARRIFKEAVRAAHGEGPAPEAKGDGAGI
jgi:hypothetical protein